MKKLLSLLLIITCLMPSGLAIADELEMHSTEHFVYAVPKGWHKEVTDESFLHFEDLANIAQCAYIGVTEQMPGSGIASGMEGANIFFDALIGMAVGDQGTDSKAEKFDINGYPAAIVQSDSNGEIAVYTFLFAEQYMFTQLLTDAEESAESLFETAKMLSGSLRFSGDPTGAVGSAHQGIVYTDGVFSESKSAKYQPYDYFEAFYNSASYKSTYVAMQGTVSLIQMQDGICVVFFDVDGNTSKEIMFFIEDSPEFEASVKSGDQLSIKAMAMGDTTELGMPVTFPLIEPFVIEKL